MRWPGLTLAALGVVHGACKYEVLQPPAEFEPEAWASVVCGVIADCDCLLPGDPLLNPFLDECNAKLWPAFEALKDAAKAADLTWDGDCMIRTAEAAVDAAGMTCPESRDASHRWQPCADECQIYYGTAAEQAPCTRVGPRASTCAVGLICGPDDTCIPPCEAPTTVPSAGPCGYANGVWMWICENGSTCDGSICVPPRVEGSACDPDLTECEAGSFCPVDTCIPRLAEGEQCTADLDCAGNWCDEGTCGSARSYACAAPFL
jgi:hypothetical protein